MKPITNQTLLSLRKEIELRRNKIENTITCHEDREKPVQLRRKFIDVLEDWVSGVELEITPETIIKDLDFQIPNLATESNFLRFSVKLKSKTPAPVVLPEINTNHFTALLNSMIDEYHGHALRKMFPTMVKMEPHFVLHGYGGTDIQYIFVIIPSPLNDEIDLLDVSNPCPFGLDQ